MNCEAVRPSLPEVAEGVPATAEVQSHLGSCPACSTELGRYRATLAQLSALREELVEPPVGALDRAMARVPAWRWSLLSRRLVVDERIRYAALSVAGVLVGAVALGLLRRRAGRQAFALAESSPSPT